MFKDQLGDWLEWQRRNHKMWLRIFLVLLGLLVLANIAVHPPIGDDHGGHGDGHGAVESHGEADDHGHGHEMAAADHGEEAGHGEAAGHGEEAGHGEAAGHGEEAEHGHGHGEAAAHGEEYSFTMMDHAHFVFDAYPGFWPIFGFGVAVLMTLVLKKVIFLLIGKPEDYYERNERY